MSTRIKTFLPIVLLGASVLFFVGGPGASSPLVFFHLWNLGHVLFFFCLVVCIHQLRPLVFWKDWLVVIALVLAAGVGIEFFQQTVGRSASSDDVLKNLYGTLAGLAVTGGSITRLWLLKTIRILSFVLLVPSLAAAGYAAYSDLRMRFQFPLINSFENNYELNQVVNIGLNVRREQSSNHAAHGNFSLAVHLAPEKYSGVKWLGRYGDWSSYDFVTLEIYHEGTTPFDVVLKIADLTHDLGSNSLNDRYNQGFTLVPGKNKLRVELNQVRTAPETRLMQMDEITCVELFSVNLSEPQVIYMDNLRLE